MSNTINTLTALLPELKHRSLSNKQILAFVGLGITAYAAFVAIYNSATGISKENAVTESADPTLIAKRNTQFIVMIIISCLAIVLGLIVSYVIRTSSWIIIPLAVALMGVLGLIYSIGIKSNEKVQMGLSITLFIIFLIYGIYVGVTDKKHLKF